MKIFHRICRTATAMAFASTLTAMATPAQAAYPEQPVTIIVSFPAGGATDAIARILGAKLSEIWHQRVLVENRTGAGGNIGANYVAKAGPNGYTLLMGSPAETVINPLLYPEMQYDAAKDLVPVTKAGSAPLLLVVNPSVPANNVEELIKYVKANDGKVSYASSGTGGPQHLAGEQFKMMTHAHILHVPYKGGAPAMTDLVGGQVQMFFSGLPPALPFVKARKAKAIAVTTKSRSSLVPDIPSLAESGLPGFDIENWQGLFAPAGVSADIVKKIADDVGKALSDPEVAQKLAAQGISPAPTSPEQFKAFIDNERKQYADIIKSAHISIK